MTSMGQRQSESTLRAINGVLVAPLVPGKRRRRFGRTTPIVAGLAVLLGGFYVGYQRIGTVANADLVEYTQNLAGGFLAIGMTDDQPGFLLLSEPDRTEVEVESDLMRNWAAGAHTVVRIVAPRAESTVRLRGPIVVTVFADGTLAKHDVDFTFEEFEGMRRAADCSFKEAMAKKRCGSPFADVGDYLSALDPDRIPAPVQAFLTRYAPPQRRKSPPTRPR